MIFTGINKKQIVKFGKKTVWRFQAVRLERFKLRGKNNAEKIF